MVRAGGWAAAIGGLLMLLACEALAAPAGAVLAISGECTREAGGQRTPLKLGDPVEVGDAIEVPATARLTLRRCDGSGISAAPGRRMTIQSYAVDDQAKSRDVKLSL